MAIALILALAQLAPAAKPIAPPAPAVPMFEADLRRLAELMGALAYLRDLCHDGDGAAFRQRITALIEADGGPQEEKDRLAGAFNRSFEGYSVTYRVCTSNARATIADFLVQSQIIARQVATRYGGG